MPSVSEDEFKQRLTAEQYRVLREKGTEAPGSGKYVDFNKEGDFACAACGQMLFKSDSKFESTMPGLVGWPAFSELANSDAVKLVPDSTLGMARTEIVCANCGSHLGHLFENDPSSPTGDHYCVNSVALNFKDKS